MQLAACRTADPADDRANRRPTHRLKIASFWLFGLFAAVMAAAFSLDQPRQGLASIVRLLRSPPVAEPGQLERYWGLAEARTEGDSLYAPSAQLLCEVESQYYQSGKGGGWRREARRSFQTGAPTLALPDGRVLSIANRGAHFAPFVGTPPGAVLEARYRALYPHFRGPRMFQQCLRSGPVYVDGCIRPPVGTELPSFERCDDAPAVTLTDGPRRLRMAEYARTLAFALCISSVALAGLILFLLTRWRGSSSEAGLSLAVGLAPRGLAGVQADPDKTRREWLGLLPWLLVPACVWGLAACTAVPQALGWAALCAVLPALIVHDAAKRRAKLTGLVQTLDQRPTSPLGAAEGELVELAVRVATNAPVQTAPLGQDQVAHVSLEIWQRVVRGSGKSSQVHFDAYHRSSPFGRELAIEDSTGHGTLDLTDAFLDFPARQVLAHPADFSPPIRALIGVQSGDFLVRESVLRPGDALFVMGPVRRTLDPHGQGRGAAYRAVPTRARVASDADDDRERFPLFVHAGTEQSLRAALQRGVARERLAVRVLSSSMGIAGVVVTALVLACLV